MGAALSLVVLALPTILVGAAYYVLRAKPSGMRAAMLLVVGATWATATWFWISYNRQLDDVGLIVDGLLASAISVAALIASLAALFFLRRA